MVRPTGRQVTPYMPVSPNAGEMISESGMKMEGPMRISPLRATMPRYCLGTRLMFFLMVARSRMAATESFRPKCPDVPVNCGPSPR